MLAPAGGAAPAPAASEAMPAPRPPATRRHARPALLSLAALAGCAGVVELGTIDAGRRRGADRTAGAPTLAADSMPRGIGAARPGTPHPEGARERRVCRASRPAGWIAVAYVPGDDCPRAAGDATNTAAVVVQIAGRGPNAVLDVCADERVPRGWRADGPAIADAAGRCPGAAPDGRSAVLRIRRVQ